MAGPENNTCQEHLGVETGIQRILEILEKQDERLDGQEERLKEGDKRFQKIQIYMEKKDLTNGYTAEDIREFKENKKTWEQRITNLEKNSATKTELEGLEEKLRQEIKDLGEKLPSKTLIYINTAILSLFIIAVLLEAARDAPVMKFLGL